MDTISIILLTVRRKHSACRCCMLLFMCRVINVLYSYWLYIDCPGCYIYIILHSFRCLACRCWWTVQWSVPLSPVPAQLCQKMHSTTTYTLRMSIHFRHQGRTELSSLQLRHKTSRRFESAYTNTFQIEIERNSVLVHIGALYTTRNIENTHQSHN